LPFQGSLSMSYLVWSLLNPPTLFIFLTSFSHIILHVSDLFLLFMLFIVTCFMPSLTMKKSKVTYINYSLWDAYEVMMKYSRACIYVCKTFLDLCQGKGIQELCWCI
jgi:hypothetical protein